MVIAFLSASGVNLLHLLLSRNLSNNHLEGSIPLNISSCTAFNELNLSANNFKSSIPVELGHIINLDTLEFETELETICSIRHRNLVTLRGYALTPNGNLLFYDYMENGSLWDLLHSPLKKVKLDWGAHLRIAVGAAEGLVYLHHDCNPHKGYKVIKYPAR
ncbi:LRR receptor serine/threonine-protein kinase ERL1 [Spatholobus suberectus]|nr:LRR receptor serine/threonine-protein kinase ERL1 [Spatholobus suberectus]